MAPADPWDFAALQPRREAAASGASEAGLGCHAAVKPSEGSVRRGGGGSGLALGGADAGRDRGLPDGRAALALDAETCGAEQPPGSNGATADGMSSLVPPEVRWVLHRTDI